MERYDALKTELKRQCSALELREREPMAKHTSFRIGGPVALMALPKTVEEAICAARAASDFGIEPFFMGNGSNLLAADDGVDAFVIKMFDGVATIERTGDCGITAGSGALLSQIAMFACKNGLGGLEFAHGIPGTLGGAITMNAGAYGGEMSQVVLQTACLTPAGQVETVSGNEHDFSYRHSAFSDGRRLILRSTLRLVPGESESIRGKMEELREKRRASQPLEWPSGGSTFKRPASGYAAALIDQCGLKGTSVGGAQVSEKHAGFVINRGGATCRDVLSLVELVRETVLRETGIVLELEIKTIGFK